ncbi:MAG: insulinase family protein [Magnetococcales bacterium]|nr:insulinase family protein [Magnetococcales bacterium]
MSHSAFEMLRREPIPALNLIVESHRHHATGARHLHLATDDPHNAFLVAFLTVPEDSTGVAHILEHTVLCGSERYPVRDPFFMMLRRTLATFMNAFTSSDWTAYPFASQSRKDFDNLLNVYLDAAFFPRLEPLDFAQEGCRVEPADPTDPSSPLVFKGVVFNEMKGAMSSASRVLWERISHHQFPTTTYHYNSGGDPETIPDLTWEQLKAFHARHYHPSNAVFMTYGNIPAADHQAVFQERVLCRFRSLDVSGLAVPDEQRRAAPLVVTEPYALDEGEPREKTHIVLSWLLGNAADLESLLQAHLLTGVLMDNSSSPLLQALETSKLGSSPSPACGLDDSTREMLFVCGLEGSEPERAEAVEEMILTVLRTVADQGVDPQQVAAVFHQLELARREVGGDGFPYGLKLMMTALPAALHGGDPVGALAVEPVLEKLRRQIDDPDFLPGLVRRWLLDNPHRLRLTLRPDTGLSEARRLREADRLARLRNSLDPTGRAGLSTQAGALRQRQESEDDPEILPRLRLGDVPRDLPIPLPLDRPSRKLDVTWFDRPTNGLVYQQVILDLPMPDPDLVDLLSLYGSLVTEVGSGPRDYLATQARQALVCGGLSARATVHGAIDDAGRLRGVFILSSKALQRNQPEMNLLLRDTLVAPRFDERSRLRELVAQMRASAELRVADNGHNLALSAAAAGLSPVAAMADRWGGLTAVRRLKTLDAALANGTALDRLANDLQRLAQVLAQVPRRLLVIGEDRHFAAIADSLADVWPGLGTGTPNLPPFSHPARREAVRVGWRINAQVQYCARVHPAVPYLHGDAPALLVLGQFLRNGFLHRAIRERGGAYGGGAGYDADSATFRFYSYRDPRLEDTLADFDRAVPWLLDTRHPEHALEEAILGVVASIDRPGSPAGEAKRAYHDRLHGRTPERRRAFRERVLATSLEDLRQVATRWVRTADANTAVLGHGPHLDRAAAGLGLRLETL